jgi:predicted secreted protein
MTAVDEPARTLPDQTVPISMRLRVGESDAIVFQGHMSTGYSWDSTVEPPGSPCVVTSWCLLPDPLRRMGGPELDILVVTGVKPGAATVTATYHRRWDPDLPPAETHEIAVTVER